MYRAVTGPSLSSFRRMDAALEKLTLRRALLSPAQLRLCSALCIDAHAAAHPPAPAPAAPASAAPTPASPPTLTLPPPPTLTLPLTQP